MGNAARLSARIQRLIAVLLPASFQDQLVEREFLDEYRRAGLRSAAYACSVAIAAYFLIWVVDVAFNGWSGTAAIRRMLVMSSLSIAILMVMLIPGTLLSNYNRLMGALVLSTYVLAVTLPQVFSEGDPSGAVNPTALIGIWMVYGFFRLPLQLSILLMGVGGAFALFGYRLSNLDDPAIRTFVYIAIANLLGVTHSRSVELRERQLFSQRQELGRVESELRDRNRVAEMASAEKSRLIAAVSHDLRQPMMAAKLHMSVLRQRLEVVSLPALLGDADRAQEAISFLGDTLEDLLLAARYESGVQPIQIAATSLGAILDQLEGLLQPEAKERQVALLVRRPKQYVVMVTDEHALLRSLVNLVTNALKFSDDGRSTRARVVVRAGVRGGFCRIAVIDNGIGISDGEADAIWNPFYQIGNAERNRGKGLGLGLYLVKQTLLRLDGHSIVVRSQPGKGSCFFVSIPLYENGMISSNETQHEASCNSSAKSSPLPSGFVLLIEDDRQARAALEAQLEAWELEFSSGGSLEEVLRCLAQDREVNMIIADYRLPGDADGIEVIAAVRKQLGYSADAILITADVDLITLQAQLPLQTALLRKPFEPYALKSLLRDALSKP